MRLICLILTLIQLFGTKEIFAQKQFSVWNFGYNASYNLKTNQYSHSSLMRTGGSCASICNANGELQLYSDGKNLWNGKGNLITSSLKSSNLQKFSIFIAPVGEDERFYYIYTRDGSNKNDWETMTDYDILDGGCQQTTPDFYHLDSCVYYSLIDMQLNNGKGGIVGNKLNIPVCKMSPGMYMQVAKHSNKKDNWLIVNNIKENSFFAFHFSVCGIEDTVISNMYPEQIDSTDYKIVNYWNDLINKYKPYIDPCLFIAPDCKKILLGSGLKPALYDFNNTNGAIKFKKNLGYNNDTIINKLNNNFNQYLCQTLINNDSKTAHFFYQYFDKSTFEPFKIGVYSVRFDDDFSTFNHYPVNNYPPAHNAYGTSKSFLIQNSLTDSVFIGHWDTYLDGKIKKDQLFQFDMRNAKINIITEDILQVKVDKELACFNNVIESDRVASMPGIVPYYISTDLKTPNFVKPHITYKVEECKWNEFKLSLQNTENIKKSIFYIEKPNINPIVFKDSLKYNFSDAGIYNLFVVLDQGCYNDTLNGNVEIQDTLSKFAFDSTQITLYNCSSYELYIPMYYKNVIWNDGSNGLNKNITNSDFTVWVKMQNQCNSVGDTVTIVHKHSIIPNIITPNNDGMNETIEISNNINQPCTVEVYNRWGEQIFHDNNYQNNWNTSNIADGIYYYYIKVGECNGQHSWLQVAK